MNYTLAVTSCQRHDLLERTIDSFFQSVDVLPEKCVILEDGPVEVPAEMLGRMPAEILFVTNPERIGQIQSCDKLMGMVETEWVFWCEDDWLFKEGFFIEPSKAILEAYPEIFTVSLRGPPWNHPLVSKHPYPFKVAEPGWNGGWGGMCFNPGLRRKSDWVKMGPYAQGGLNMWACQSEHELSRRYLKAGYLIADLGRPIVEHLGHGRSKTKETF